MKAPAGSAEVGAQLVTRVLGLHPYTALLAIALDFALFGSNLLGPAVSLTLAALLSVPLAWAVSRMQRALHGNGRGLSWVKGIVVAGLVCVPTPIFSAPLLLSAILSAFSSDAGPPERQDR